MAIVNIMENYPKIAVVYLLYRHNESYVDDMVSAMEKLSYPKDKVALVIVNNPIPGEGVFARYIENNVLPKSDSELPRTIYLPQSENLGFAGGNNVGVKWAIENDYDYVYFHNDDGFVARNAFEPLIEAAENDQEIGVAQSLMMLHPETELINSTGNSFQYLGFGYCNEYRKKLSNLNLPKVKEISYASGAAMLVSVKLIKEFGTWDHDFFLYHEDLEWSFRLRAAGYKIVMVSDSLFYHKYQFSRSIEKFYWMERNRYGVMLMFFKWKTLILLLPMLVVLEVGLIFFAWRGGWLDKQLKVYKYWSKSENRKLWLGKRKHIQKIRKVTDRHLLGYSVAGIYFQEKSMENPILRYIGNPLMTLYYKVVVKGLIRW